MGSNVVQVEQMDIGDLDVGKETKIRTMKTLITHWINILKRISQNLHAMYISIQGTKYLGYEALTVLTPLFTQWGPYSLFFDKLMPMLT